MFFLLIKKIPWYTKFMKDTFGERVLELVLSIQSGEVSTYGDIARAAGGSGQSARSVSGILGRYAKKGYEIPFHRIVYSNGKVWKSDLFDSSRNKKYIQEGVDIDERGYVINFESIRKKF